jgi:hypothetical protein
MDLHFLLHVNDAVMPVSFSLREKLTLVTGVDRLWYRAMRLLPIKCYK